MRSPRGRAATTPHTSPEALPPERTQPSLLQPPSGIHTAGTWALLLQLWPVFLSSARVGVPQSAAAFAPSHRGREQAPDEGAHPEVGSKPKLSSRGSETKRHRNSWTAVQLMDHIPVICLVTTAPVEHLNRGVFLQKTLV